MSPFLPASEEAGPDPAHAQARSWLQRLSARPAGAMPLETDAPADPVPFFAAFCAEALAAGKNLLLLVADDQLLPDLSNALDLAIRPLCLILPDTDFTARITLRASLSLLRSRLQREAEPAWRQAWDAQKARLETNAGLWQAALAWSAGERPEPWPGDVAELFPLRIAPVGRALSLESPQRAPDLVLVLEREPLPEDADALLAASRVLVFNPPPVREAFLGALALSDRDLRLRGEVETVGRAIAELELELATAQGEMSEFSHRYHTAVGERMARLDELQAELALRQAAQAPDDPQARERAETARERADESRRDERRYREAAAEAGARFRPGADIKKLFRQVAQKIHPDRARDEADRERRTRLMAEANRAYRLGDGAALREVLRRWNSGEEAAETPADRELMERQLERLRRRLAEIQGELDGLYASRLYELFQAENQARRQQRDLLEELTRQLDEQIAALLHRLAALGWREEENAGAAPD